jgi:hypothetical protein
MQEAAEVETGFDFLELLFWDQKVSTADQLSSGGAGNTTGYQNKMQCYQCAACLHQN